MRGAHLHDEATDNGRVNPLGQRNARSRLRLKRLENSRAVLVRKRRRDDHLRSDDALLLGDQRAIARDHRTNVEEPALGGDQLEKIGGKPADLRPIQKDAEGRLPVRRQKRPGFFTRRSRSGLASIRPANRSRSAAT